MRRGIQARLACGWITSPLPNLLTPLGLTAIAGAVVFWTASLGAIDVRAMDDTGLISQLPLAFFAALLLLNAAFALLLAAPRPSAIAILLAIGTLILFLYGVTSIVEDLPRISITWLHAGFADVVLRTGDLPPLDARFDWPGFFALSAFISGAAGLEHPLQLAAWAPVAFNLAYLPPLLVIYRAVTSDLRLAWLAVWTFYLANWVGQDYFSPQGLNFLLYLVVIAILLAWFRPSPRWDPGGRIASLLARLARRPLTPSNIDGQPVDGGVAEGAAAAPRRDPGGRIASLLARLARRPLTPSNIDGQPVDGGVAEGAGAAPRRGALVLLVTVLIVAIASSHQLTPFALLASVTALVLLRRCSLTFLPILIAVVVGTWISYMAVDFLTSRLSTLIGEVGQTGSITSANVGRRIAGSQGHLLIVYVRLGLTFVLWSLAVVGIVRRLRAGSWDVSMIALTTVPFGLILLQSYGGEMLLRVYFFSLPFVAFFVATLLLGVRRMTTWKTVSAIACCGLLLSVGMLLARYGNERMDLMSADDYDATLATYALAPPGAWLFRGNYNDPIGYRDYEMYRYRSVEFAVRHPDLKVLAGLLRQAPPGEAFLVLTRSQRARAELIGGLPVGDWDRLLEKLHDSDDFVLTYENPTAVVYTLRELDRND